MENLVKEISEYSFMVSIEERVGVAFYEPKTDKLLRGVKKTKGTITDKFEKVIDKITVGFTPENATYVDIGIPFIRVQDIDKNGIIDIENCKRIADLHHEDNLKSRVTYNDILLVITGATVGKTALFKFKNIEANINQNIVKISVNQKEVSPDYMFYFLRSDVAQFQLIRNAQRIAQEYLNYPAIKSIYVTYPTDIDDQEQIVNEVKNYEDKSWNNLKAYNECIKEISRFLVDRLNIKLPIEPTGEQISVSGFSNNLKNRIDCYSHSVYYRSIVKKLKENQEINKLIKGKELNILEDRIGKKELEELKAQEFKYVELKHTTELGTIKGHKEDILFNLPTRARQIMKTDDILLPRPIGSTEEIAVVPEEYNNQLCSTGFIVIRPEDYDNALLLWSILKSDLVQKQLFYLQSGSLQPEITPTNFKEKVLIPIPNKEIQEEIIKETEEKLKQAKDSLNEYEFNKKKAKDVFVNLLLKNLIDQ